MQLSDLWTLELVLAAFAGGAFGAAIGALPAFTVTGLLVVAGEVHALAVDALGNGPEVALTDSLAFGPVFGPHVSFAGGAAAVAYAARRGYLDDSVPYHPAKNVVQGLGSRPDVLAVGGVFGVVGYWAATLSGSLALPWDPVAFGVVASALAHRLALGYDLVGAPLGRLFDMRPFEEAKERAATDGASSGGSATDGGIAGRTVEPWLPYQYRWSHVTVLGLAVGALGGYVAFVTASAFLAFGVSVVALVYVSSGVAKVPVTHHVTLPASTAVVALAGGASDPAAVAAVAPLGVALAVGAAFGLVGALAGELAQRALYAHADTHLDPPAASIVCTSLLIALLAMAGVLPDSAWVPLP